METTKKKIKIKKGDMVTVLTGKKQDRGKIGKVLRVYPKKGRILVEGINIAKKSMKADPQKNKQGGIQHEEMPLHISNVKIYCSKCNKPVKIRMKFSPDGKRKFRICNKCGEILDKTK